MTWGRHQVCDDDDICDVADIAMDANSVLTCLNADRSHL